ncbi:MAG: hypothetical protein FGM46_04905 [Ferruginibacter sp.]|nr:hypothetical protein [Ferruginibacter sp.]
MQIKYSCSYWGNDHFSPKEFIENVHLSGYNGAELFLQPPDQITKDFMEAIDTLRIINPDFYLISMQIIFPAIESVDTYIARMVKNLAAVAELNPLFINSHTGKDHFSFDDNCRVIEA